MNRRVSDLDFPFGEIYADMALCYARAINNPAVLTAIMATINTKVAAGELVIGGLEAGFFDRVAKLAYVGSLN